MPLDAIEIDTAPNPTAAIVVLHGLGADGNDFVPFTRELDLAAVGGVRFVFPHAPTRPVRDRASAFDRNRAAGRSRRGCCRKPRANGAAQGLTG